ncbi:glutathione-dependent reductase [Agaricicola taiwanensis]|uniref:Glutathione-dependent reductase n=1 Tax=Agaricicola taiwanensis TaxID=591372 RepID=A0A8J2YDH6_9RHOB|nr:glutathione S-transferase family protein [Agaricicola taiwanensis]GGE39937.1 glutathione-dependent reductase [Agaricicola taiwanensis]
MGLLVDGIWQDQWYDTKSTGGRFKRQDAAFRDRITADGSSGFKAEAGRYHLYVSLACPWAHRALIFRKLKKLEDLISVSVVDPHMGSEGWTLSEGADPINGARRLYEVYLKAKPNYTGRVTVPALWDREKETIVSNESAEIIRMFNEAFNGLTGSDLDFYPQTLREEIDALNAEIYAKVNNGVYKAGFATSQEAYSQTFSELFEMLDRLENRLSSRRYLLGSTVTEADWRLFTTLVRFDPVYVGHFKCNLRRIADYPNLSGYVKDLYQVPGVAETVNLEHIKRHYYTSHPTINPTGIIPDGPLLDYEGPHDRTRLG